MGQEHGFVRSAAWLFVIAGLVTVGTTWVPNGAIVNANIVDGAGVTALVIGIVAWLLPWERWPRPASLSLVPLALALIAVGDAYGSASAYTYGIYFVVLFTWIGLCHRQRTSLAVAPFATGAYLGPILAQHRSVPGALSSVLVTIPVCVLVGETVSWAMSQMTEARKLAEHSAGLFRAVVRGTTTITALDRDQVLAGVVDSVTGLGLDCVGLAVLSPDSATYSVRHARGLPSSYTAVAHKATAGVVGLVRTQRNTLVIDDYQRSSEPDPGLARAGLRAVAAAPVWVNGAMAAVLFAGSKSRRRRISEEDAEALSLLAVHAGRTLENAQRFGEEQRARQLLAEVSVRDELTGIGNRRHAMALLESLRPGDAVVMIDLDHFKEINDSDGHDAGDRVLLALADHLRTGIRDADLVARYGGEEFLVVLRQAAATGVETAERLVATWRDLDPRTTFSAGVAVHRAGRTPAQTVARADAALYAAKRTGRDRVCENLVDA
ncbi:MAG TPA: sensor domain-containing diguanylate cyclase [Acidimicrobiales bacterium]|nr:sensor domain-containing diguanylate cyclase [Acidimicrobiales bacterium]